MDISNLQTTYPSLIKYLRANGYSKGYIGEIMTDIKQVLHEANNPDIKSYEDYYEFVKSKFTSKATLHHKYKIIGKLKQFDLYGILPTCNKRSGFLKVDRYPSLSDEFRALVDNFEASAKSRGVSDTYIYHTKNAAIRFFAYQQFCGNHRLSEISETDSLNYFYDSGKMARGYHVIKQIKSVLLENKDSYSDCCIVASYLPATKSRIRSYQYLEEAELNAIKSFLQDETSDISYRDRAILITALFTGLRGGDIKALKLTDIDWENNLITFVQNKTQSHLSIPLRPVVGNAIWDYIEKERPTSKFEYVFLTTYKNKHAMSSSAMSQLTISAFRKIGIRQDGGKIGLHLFRHNLATSLLGKGVQSPIITSILGHNSPASLNAYLSADLIRLKQCALSIEHFPLRKEVLSI